MNSLKRFLQSASVLVALAGLLATFALGAAPAAAEISLSGAGASFPAPIYYKWIDEYNKLHPDVKINYQSIGSGGGIRQISNGLVDFGASDAFLTDEELKGMPAPVVHIPTVMGAVVITYNLPGINEHLRFTPEVLADIFLGKIKYWNDRQLQSLNPGVKLPNTPIAVVHRSDASGTSNIFTTYLSTVSREWNEKVGKGLSVNWPVGVGAKGNEGVSGTVKQIPGAIGYVELAYAFQNKLPYAALRNKAGRFVLPSIASTSAAAAGVEIPDDYRVMIVNAEGPTAYPIASFTYLLVYKEQKDPVKAEALLKFIWWAIHDGEKYAEGLLYAPLPEAVVKKLERTLKSITYKGEPVLK